MELDKQTQLNELYAKAKRGEMIQQYQLSFIPSELDRNYYYKDLLSVALNFRKENNIDYTEIENILNGTAEREMRIKELELELLKLRGVDNVNN